LKKKKVNESRKKVLELVVVEEEEDECEGEQVNFEQQRLMMVDVVDVSVLKRPQNLYRHRLLLLLHRPNLDRSLRRSSSSSSSSSEFGNCGEKKLGFSKRIEVWEDLVGAELKE